ncbi:MAG TPA: hypothetical protein VFS21_38610 [Roseiflexaceae bacterium]|nr:hypothetical protein [Roseiflexaceae bacterium]
MTYLRRLIPTPARGDLLLLLVCVSALLLAGLCYALPRGLSLAVDASTALLPRRGLTPVEPFADRPGRFSWTTGSGLIRPGNPGGPVLLRIVLAGGPGRNVDALLRAPGVDIPLPVQPEPRTYRLLLPPASGERLPLAIESPTHTVNNRDLGVVVSDLRVDGAGAAPRDLVLLLLLASAGVYLLLRQGGWRPPAAAGAVLALQAGAMLWQGLGGWGYGLLGQVLLLGGLGGLGAAAVERLIGTSPPLPMVRPVLDRRDLAAVALVLAAGLCLRVPWLLAPDPVGDLTLSARQLAGLGERGLAGAYTGPSDYMPLRLYYLLGVSQVAPVPPPSGEPLAPLTQLLIKLPGLLADAATTVLIYLWALRWRGRRGAALVAALYALAPPVWINVAWWGQVDALLMLPLVASMLLLDRAGGRWAWLAWAAALLIKTQAILLAPLLAVATLRRHGCAGLARGAAAAGALLAAGFAPLILVGKGAGLAESYLGAVGRFPRTTSRAFNLWYLALGGRSESDAALALGPLSYRTLGILLIGAAAALICAALLRRADGPARVHAAAALALAFFALPTQIHERYLFLSLAFLALSMARDLRLALPFLLLVASATLNILATLSGFSPPLYEALSRAPALGLALAAVNLAVLGGLMVYLLRMRDA